MSFSFLKHEKKQPISQVASVAAHSIMESGKDKSSNESRSYQLEDLSPSEQQILEQHWQSDGCQSERKAHYELLSDLDAANGVVVEGVLLEDSAGRVQVLLSANCLLDLSVLKQSFKRDFHAVSAEQLFQFNQKMEMTGVSAVPMALSVPTVIDSELLKADVLYLKSGTENALIKTASNLLQTLPEANVSFSHFSSSLSTSEEGKDDDKRGTANQFTSRRIQGRLEDTFELPPLPATAQSLLQLLAHPDSNIEELVRVVEVDPSLAAQVISWAQSPYYSAPGSVNSIHDAITRVLGYDMVVNLALGLALSKTLRLPKEGVNGHLSFWEQSVYCGALMEGLVRALPAKLRPSVGMAYLTGLLHNFGYLLLAEVFPPHFTSLCRYLEVNSHLDYGKVEQFLLQTDRVEMGYQLMDSWGLPADVCLAVANQNQPRISGGSSQLASMLFIVTRLLRRFHPTDIASGYIPPRLLIELQLDEETLMEMGEAVFGKQDQLQNMARQFGH